MGQCGTDWSIVCRRVQWTCLAHLPRVEAALDRSTSCVLPNKASKACARVAILGKSHPSKNRNLSRLISNLSRVNWSSERNSVYCFSTVFTLFQQREVPGVDKYLSVPSTCLPRNLSCLVFESSNTFLTYTCFTVQCHCRGCSAVETCPQDRSQQQSRRSTEGLADVGL